MTERRGFAPIALVLASLLLLLTWLGGHGWEPALTVESYAADSAAFTARFEAQLAAHATGETIGTMPVVRPPPGDVVVRVRRWEFSPALELQPGQTYRLHLLAEDVVHSAAIGDAEELLMPGVVKVVTLVTPPSGRVRIQCGEYCGLGHTKMIGSIEIVR